MNHELWKTWLRKAANKLIQVSQASDDLTLQSSLASGTVRILSGSELADGLMLAPGLARLLQHRRQMFGKRSGSRGKPELGLVTSECSGQWLVSLFHSLIKKKEWFWKWRTQQDRLSPHDSWPLTLNWGVNLTPSFLHQNLLTTYYAPGP